MLTGDNPVVTARICLEVGIDAHDILTGTQVEAMSDVELEAEVEKREVFARLTPLQKTRILKALQKNGHTVGFLGDGINDAPALRDADVGISVDSAADIAKESSDIILLEKDLMVLEEGVIKGRETFGNIIKYLNMTASSNFGNVFSVLVASAFIPFLPMLAIHLLIQNLMYDISQLSLPWDKMDKEFLRKPRKWDAKNIGRFMLWIGPTSSIFDITTFALMWYVFAANNVEAQALFQSGWFIEGLLSQTLVVHMLRTQKIPFIQSRATLPVLLTTGFDYGDRRLYPILAFRRDGWTGAAAAQLLPVVGSDITELLSGGARNEALLYQTLWSMVLMLSEGALMNHSSDKIIALIFLLMSLLVLLLALWQIVL
ncbi:Magnesium transporting ATPase, P-type 1 [Salmonella enterica subsp. arizonae]|uniref:Magnesium transporting ATPase, P-type 1 n=11 Tax=Salmonella enterica TaxID=28901 RepID=A0A379T431_SALER|nr:Magnesium transporting ATPase, P-type 1 [Salmonella enterica subsp. arizonae]